MEKQRLTKRQINKLYEEYSKYFDGEYVKDILFDYLNNVLVWTYDDLVFVAKQELKRRWIKIWNQELADYLSEFIDKKELYNLYY